MTLDELRQDPRIEAVGWSADEWRWVLEQVLGLSPLDRLREPERQWAPEACQPVYDLAARALQGEPLAYLLGVAYFDGLPIHVSPSVLIPRPDTEILLQTALQKMPNERARVLDLGTGSGALALAMKKHRPAWQVTATDVDPEALAMARNNAERLSLDVTWVQADGLTGLSSFDLIVSNPPYIAINDPDVDHCVHAHEPHLALYSGVDGLALIRRLIAEAQNHLVDGGWFCLEHGWQQKEAVESLARDARWDSVETVRDLAGHDRVTLMRKPHATDV